MITSLSLGTKSVGTITVLYVPFSPAVTRWLNDNHTWMEVGSWRLTSSIRSRTKSMKPYESVTTPFLYSGVHDMLMTLSHPSDNKLWANTVCFPEFDLVMYSKSDIKITLLVFMAPMNSQCTLSPSMVRVAGWHVTLGMKPFNVSRILSSNSASSVTLASIG